MYELYLIQFDVYHYIGTFEDMQDAENIAKDLNWDCFDYVIKEKVTVYKDPPENYHN